MGAAPQSPVASGLPAEQATLVSGVWVHRKGKHYLVLGAARDENNLGAHAEPQVVYVSLEADPAGPVMHTRSISEFLERFEPLSAGAPAGARHRLGA